MKHALFTILVLFTSQAHGQVYRLYCVGNSACYGSAVCVSQQPDGKHILVTAGHNLRGMSRYFVDTPSGRVEATLLTKSRTHDLAALTVQCQRLPIYRLSPLNRTSGKYVLTGYGQGRNRMQPRQATITKGEWQTVAQPIGVQTYDLRFSGAAIQGESGGALVSTDGKLVGIVSCTARSDGYACGYEAVCQMFGAIGWRVCPPTPQYGPPAQLPAPYQGSEQPPYVPEEQPVPEPTPEPQTRIEYRYIKGERGPAGPQGPAGERGPVGPPGTFDREIVRQFDSRIQANTDRIIALENRPGYNDSELNKRLSSLEKRVMDLESKPVEIPEEPAPIETKPEERVLYFTSKDHPDVVETDEKARKLKEAGYPITIITLNPKETNVRDVPRIFVLPEERTISGKSNVLTYLAFSVKKEL